MVVALSIVALILLAGIWLALVAVVAHLARLADVDKVGKEIWINAFGNQRRCVVTGVGLDGALLVEPVPAAPVQPT